MVAPTKYMCFPFRKKEDLPKKVLLIVEQPHPKVRLKK